MVAAVDGDDVIWWEQLGSPLLTVTTPNGGEIWRLGTSHEIQWTSQSDEDIAIELLNGDVTEVAIVESTENDGAYEWSIPTDISPGDNYRVRCTLVGGLEQDISNAPFTISSSPTLTLTPYQPPIIIPHSGGPALYWLEIENLAPVGGAGQYWSVAILPNGQEYGPLFVTNIALGPWGQYAPLNPFSIWVPAYAPPGIYEFLMHLGLHPTLIVSTDGFEIEKLSGASTSSLPESEWSIADWQNEAWELTGAPTVDGRTVQLPTSFAVAPAYPNPFNASTAISTSLPVAAKLTVTVHDVLGREVVVLADEQYTAGEHQLTFHAIGLASGLYFVRASVPDHLDKVHKVMLVR